MHNFYVERWLIPAYFDTKYVTTVFLTRDNQTRIVGRVNYPYRVALWWDMRRLRRLQRQAIKKEEEASKPPVDNSP